jgi:hypothetical protein
MRRYDAFRWVARALAPADRGGRTVGAPGDELGRAGLPWEEVIELASQQLVTPALDQALRDAGRFFEVPAEVRDYLEAVHGLNGERNRKIADQVVEITAALNAIGTEPVLLKGVAYLVEDLYGDPAARVIGDIDLLVSAERIEDAIGALLAIGYREAGLDDVSFAAHHHSTPLARGDAVAAVELHTAPVPQAFSRLLPAEQVRRNARPLAVGAHRAWLPAPRDLVVHNIVAGQLADRHYWSGRIALRPLCDLVRLRLAHEAAIDWPEVLATLDRAGYGSACRAWLMAAQLFLGQAPPAGVEPTLGARFACWRSGAQIRSPRLMALGEAYGYHRAMLERLRAGPRSRRQLLARLLHPRGYRRYLRSFKAHRSRLE